MKPHSTIAHYHNILLSKEGETPSFFYAYLRFYVSNSTILCYTNIIK